MKHALSEACGWPPHLLKRIEVSRIAVYVDPLDGTNEYASGEREAVWQGSLMPATSSTSCYTLGS